MRRADRTFAPDPAELPRARRLVASCLEAWGLGGRSQPFQLLVSELFTNAIRHGAGPIEVRLSAGDGRLRLEVHDRGGGRPALRPVERSGSTIGGWGLRFVDHLVERWGTVVESGRTVVWLEQPLPADA